MSQLEQAILAAAKAFVASYNKEENKGWEFPVAKNNVTPLKSDVNVVDGIGSHCGKQLMKSKFCEDDFTGYYWCGDCKKNYNKDFSPSPKKRRA